MAQDTSPRDAPYPPFVTWHVVLDSTAIGLDFRLTGVDIHFLMTHAGRQGFQVCVPEVVVLETINHYREELSKANANLDRLLQAPQGVVEIVAPGVASALTPTQLQSTIEAFEASFRLRLANLGVWVEPIPAAMAGVEILLKRDLERRKPFGDQRTSVQEPSTEADQGSRGGRRGRRTPRDRSGLRDALIWESILGLCHHQPGSLAFITDNVTDFSNDERNDFDPGLLEELAGIDIYRERYSIKQYKSVKDFNDAHLRTLESSGSVPPSAEDSDPASLDAGVDGPTASDDR